MNENLGELYAALAEARQEFSEFSKSKTAIIRSDKGNYTYRYADLADIIEATAAALAKHGLVVIQDPEVVSDGGRSTVIVHGCIAHKSGAVHQLRPLPMPVVGGTAQAIGSAISYARRYQIQAALNLAAEDDDGQAAQEQPRTHQDAPGRTQGRQMTTDTRAAYNARPSASTPPETQIDAVAEVDENGPETPAHQRMFGVGLSVFGPAWNDGARAWLVRGYTKHTTPDNVRTSSSELSDDEKVLMADYIKDNAAELQAAWQKMTRKRAAEAERGQPA